MSSSPAREDDARSPLLHGRSSTSGEVWDDAEAVAKQGKKEGESKSSWYLFLLTLSIGGLQIVWSVELSNGSPYLLSLGMSKSLLAFVWIAGPLTGTLVQPYVGIRSDNCRIRWGKRKPFMVGGGIATIASLLLLAWVREIVGGTLVLFGATPGSGFVKTATIVAATFLMYCLDFAINTVQAAIRAFIVDNAPAHQQESANAWASRLTGIGNILGYISGYVDLPRILPLFGNTQFKVLCVIASLALGITLLISCSYIAERDPRLEGPPRSDNPGVISFFVQVFKSIKRLPPQIKRVCEVQLCAWVGWFPFLFYSTTYIGQLYVNPIFDQNPELSDGDIEAAWEAATRVGTFALLIYAITSFVGSILLPLIIVPTYRSSGTQEEGADSDSLSQDQPFLPRRLSTSSLSFTPSAGAAVESPNEPPARKRENKPHPLIAKLQIPGLTLRRLWFFSHILFTLCMFSTIFISTPRGGTIVISAVGISWAITLWAPFAFISAEVAQRDAKQRRRRRELRRTASHPPHPQHDSSQGYSGVRNRDGNDTGGPSFASADDGHEHDGKEDDDEDTVDQAGVILGIHNVAISMPQIVSTLVSSVIFKMFQKPRGVPYDDSVGWVLRFGGFAAIAAAWFTARLGEGVSGKGVIGDVV